MKINELDYQSMIKDVERCYGCPGRPCTGSCPLNMPIPVIISSLKRNDYSRVYELVSSNNPLPEMTTKLCDVDSQCKGNCVQARRNGGIDFREVEKFVYANFDKKDNFGGDFDKKVAIIGAGPAGLSAAKVLLKNGVGVKIFDRESTIGGAVYTGVPEYRYPKSNLIEIQKELEEMGCEFVFNTNIDSYDNLLTITKSYDYTLIGIGAQKERMLFDKLDLIYGGLNFLREYNVNGNLSGLENSNEVYVMGGGNVAFDCARVLKKHIPNVSIIYRRSIEEMPASKDEIAKAQLEDINIRFLENIIDVKQSESKKLVITTIKNKLGEMDSSGRRSPVVIEGSEETFIADGLVLAIGETPTFDCFENKLEINKDGTTNITNVYAIGDCLYGARTVAKAIGSGRDAALNILKNIKGE